LGPLGFSIWHRLLNLPNRRIPAGEPNRPVPEMHR
jgi:hypothetical protein